MNLLTWVIVCEGGHVAFSYGGLRGFDLTSVMAKSGGQGDVGEAVEFHRDPLPYLSTVLKTSALFLRWAKKSRTLIWSSLDTLIVESPPPPVWPTPSTPSLGTRPQY